MPTALLASRLIKPQIELAPPIITEVADLPRVVLLVRAESRAPNGFIQNFGSFLLIAAGSSAMNSHANTGGCSI